MRAPLLAMAALLAALPLAAQKKPAPAAPPAAPKAAPAPALAPGPMEYPFPPDLKGEVRDLEYESDQLEIQNGRMLLEIEKNKARQAALLDRQKAIAFKFASDRKIDLSLYDFEQKEVRLIRKPGK